MRSVDVRWGAVALLCLLAACGSDDPLALDHQEGPALTVARADLDAALQCSGDLAAADQAPVLMVPGTTLEPQVNFDWNWLPALTALGRPYCTIELPMNAMGDIQIAAEYVVHAVREMAATTGQKVQIIGHSQGGMVPRWALRFWPDVRDKVDDLVGLSPSNHGTVLSGGICVPGCAPAIRQQGMGSAFMAALNRDFETVPGVDYTVIYTNLDEVVVPNVTLLGASSALSGDAAQLTNVATQQVCPLNTAEHLTIGTSDPVAYALAIDALTHAGPADPSRIDPAVCLQLLMPGVNPATFATDFAALGLVVANTLLTAERSFEEPPLRCYVEGACP